MLHQIESKILSHLKEKMPAQKLSQESGIPVSSIHSFCQSLKEKGYVSLEYLEEKKTTLTGQAEKFLSDGFPEQKVHKAAQASSTVSSLSQEERTIGLAWATKNGWVKVEQGKLVSEKELEQDYGPMVSLKKLKNNEKLSTEEEKLLLKRKLITIETEKTLYIEPTAVAPEEPQSESVNVLTRDMLLSGSWKNTKLREYDISAPAEIPFAAKRHMISRLRKKITKIFMQMGFEEMYGPQIQSSFWNFDALFQPQDHPARDLADTFYLKSSSSLPKDDSLVARVKKIHEKSWGGDWLEKNAKKTVLRTHTTTVSASYLYNFCRNKQPKKYFSIGKVYRNEATDYKHLAEFFQVEGIVVWEGATFRDLLGCLREFYKKLGFEKIRFEPSYFPYTEPSLQVTVYFEKKKQWLELGGAGIFRPEVSIPLCDRYPVLAWGLSLERPLMLLNDIGDIRTFYKSNIGWIRKQKLH